MIELISREIFEGITGEIVKIKRQKSFHWKFSKNIRIYEEIFGGFL